MSADPAGSGAEPPRTRHHDLALREPARRTCRSRNRTRTCGAATRTCTRSRSSYTAPTAEHTLRVPRNRRDAARAAATGDRTSATAGPERRTERAGSNQPLHEHVQPRTDDDRRARPVERAVLLRRQDPAPRARPRAVQQREAARPTAPTRSCSRTPGSVRCCRSRFTS